MKSTIVSILVCVFIIATGFNAFGEEWTGEQKEVWDIIVADYELVKKGDVDKILETRHEDLVVLWNPRRYPFTISHAPKAYNKWFIHDLPVNWELKPLNIKIGGEYAIVVYTYKFSGKFLSDNGRIMRTLIKQDNKWKILSEMVDSCNKLPPCE